MKFQTCFTSCSISLDEQLANLIQRSVRFVEDQGHDWLNSPDIPTDFDAWVHGQLVSNAQAGFNAI